jgi:iron complex outermembrane receptor protein
MSPMPSFIRIRTSFIRNRTSGRRVSGGVLLMAVSILASSPPVHGQAITFQLPPLTVVAQKEPADAQRVPVSVTAIPAQTIDQAGIGVVSDAGLYAPNVHFTDFSARKLSNARFRGIGASPANPAITTYIDGVPQLHANTSNVELLHADQLEFVRGPQSTLFGRNTLGGVINVTSVRPAVAGDWTGSASVPFSNYGERGVRVAASGPVLGNRLAAGLAFQYREREGFSRNVLTGNDIDDRSAYVGKAQLRWTPAERWEARLIVTGERDRDGDYALSDLGGLRQAPFVLARDFEGFTERDVVATTLLTRWDRSRVTLSTTTGVVRWRTEDVTDLDYLPLPIATRRNQEESLQFTQEVRLASAPDAAVRLADDVTFGWQTGVFFFTQHYDQDATNTFAPMPPPLDFSITQQSPRAALDDVGVGVYGQGSVLFADRVEVIAGLRADHERKDAALATSTTPPLAFFPPDSMVDTDRSFSDVSPQVAVAVRVQPDAMVYGSVSRGFKAGGFNAASPGREVYEEEHTWSFEGGVKSAWAGGRITANAAVFRIDWDDLQINLPDLFVPGQFYIDNAASAVSSGVELEVNARARDGVDLFGSVGYTRARFHEAAVLADAVVGGNVIPNTPEVTAVAGAQVSHAIRPGTSVYGRGEVALRGAFHYDERNTEGQEAYTLANFRAGVRIGLAFVEGWVRNAFDTRYIPVAFEYPGFAPSGFVGEMGTPRTFGLSTGVSF